MESSKTFLQALGQATVQVLTDPFGLVARQKRREYAVSVIRAFSDLTYQEAEDVLQRLRKISERDLCTYDHTETAFLQMLCYGETVEEALRLLDKWVGLSPSWVCHHTKELRAHEARKEEEPTL